MQMLFLIHRDLRQLGRGQKIYYLDDTWLNSGHVNIMHMREWVDGEGAGRESLVAPVKGSRLIITDIGSETGVLEGDSLLSRAPQQGITMRI